MVHYRFNTRVSQRSAGINTDYSAVSKRRTELCRKKFLARECISGGFHLTGDCFHRLFITLPWFTYYI
jgi:hypothetical protein